MKILLLQPSHNYYGRKRDPYFPIGLGYIAASLLKHDYDVEVLDLNATPKSDVHLEEYFAEKKFDVIGISAMSVQYTQVEKIVKLIRKNIPKCIIVLGGALAIHSYKIVLDNIDIDYCALSEGEITFPDIIKNLDNAEDLIKINSLAFKKDGEVIVNPVASYIRDLDSIPFPAWDLFQMHTYFKYSHNTLNIISARGCPYNCNFCSKNFQGVRLRSVHNIVEEIKSAMKKFSINSFMFDDELVVVNEKRITKLCKELKKLNIVWRCQGRVNYATKEILKMMKDAGCVSVGFGVESGSPKILKNMNKVSNPEMIIKAIKNADAVGIPYYPQMIFGYVGEDEHTLKETIKICFKAGMSPAFNTATPYPGTKLYEWAISEGRIKDELEYLKGLQGNAALYVNCSTFPDKDFDKIKKKFEKKILFNYMLFSIIHPKRLMKDVFAKFKFLIYYIRAHGLIKTFKEVFRSIKKYPQLIFGRYE